MDRVTGTPAGRRKMLSTLGVAVAAVLATSACAAGQLAQTSIEKSSVDGVNASVGSIDLRAASIQAPTAGSVEYPAGSAAQLIVVFVNNGTTSDSLTSITGSAIGGWSAYADYAAAARAQNARNATLTPSASPSGSSSSASTSSPSIASTAPSGSTSATSNSRKSATASVAPSSVTPSSAAPSSAAPSSASSSGAKILTTVTLPSANRVGFGTPEATGAILLAPLTQAIRPGTNVQLTFTFATAGSVTVQVPVQLGTNVPVQVASGGSASGG